MEVAEFHGRVMASRFHVITVDSAGNRPAGFLDNAMHGAVFAFGALGAVLEPVHRHE